MMKKAHYIFIVALIANPLTMATSNGPVWPSPPDQPRVAYIDEIRCDELSPKSTIFGKLKRFVSGSGEFDKISLPFDLLVQGDRLYLTCQNIPALIEISLIDHDYQFYTCEELPLGQPISLCTDRSGILYLTDSQSKAVYRLIDGVLEPLIKSGIKRPTGISVINESGESLYVVDTKDHSLKQFDLNGNYIQTIGDGDETESGFNFPTFATSLDSSRLLINDALNYSIKTLDASGQLLSSFGAEGDGPGAFSRPKGVAVDSYKHIYVVDNLFDNVQVFDTAGDLLLVIGGGGQESGQFWSPAGINITNDTIYIADTFNNRIQILHYLGGTK